MNIFNNDQKEILRYLKTSKSFTLNQIHKITAINKSTLLYNLNELVSLKILNKSVISPRKIYYSIARVEDREDFINSITKELESEIISTKFKGIDDYKNLLDMIAAGEGEILGYGNIENKIIPEIEPILEEFRDKIAKAKRLDRFVVPDSLRNIDLLKDHFKKPEWKKVFRGRVIERSKMNVDGDIYCWDNSVGICSFKNKEFNVNVYTDEIVVESYRALLLNLWENAREV